MTRTTIENLKRGKLFRLTNDSNAQLWLRSEYNKKFKVYECFLVDSIGDENNSVTCIFCKSETPVWIR